MVDSGDLESQLEQQCKCPAPVLCKGLVQQSASQVDSTDSPQHDDRPKRLRVYQAWEGNEVRGSERGRSGSREGRG